MKYTLWTGGRLLGETDLGYARWRPPRYRAGWFVPSDAGAAIEHGREAHLELRRGDGRVVPTEWIDVRNTDPAFRRYRVQLMLVDDAAIP